jgi:hypothetical protein
MHTLAPGTARLTMSGPGVDLNMAIPMPLAGGNHPHHGGGAAEQAESLRRRSRSKASARPLRQGPREAPAPAPPSEIPRVPARLRNRARRAATISRMKVQLHVNGVPIDPVFDDLVDAFRAARSHLGERGWFMAASRLRTHAEVTSPEGTRIQVFPISEAASEKPSTDMASSRFVDVPDAAPPTT